MSLKENTIEELAENVSVILSLIKTFRYTSTDKINFTCEDTDNIAATAEKITTSVLEKLNNCIE